MVCAGRCDITCRASFLSLLTKPDGVPEAPAAASSSTSLLYQHSMRSQDLSNHMWNTCIHVAPHD